MLPFLIGKDAHEEKQKQKPRILCFSDGCSRGNPGIGGCGSVVDVPGLPRREGRLSLGMTTNNIAELSAILLTLNLLKQIEAEDLKTRLDGDIDIATDSRYAQGVLTLGWKAKKNGALIAKIKQLLTERQRTNPVTITWVKGHAGIAGNERADQLANLGADECDQLKA